MICTLVIPLLLLLAVAPSARDAELMSVEDREAAPQILRALKKTRVSVSFQDAALADVVRFFATATGVNVMISPALQVKKDELPKITLRLADVTAQTALRALLDLSGLGAVVRHGVLMITTKEDARGQPVLRLYYIADLTLKLRDFAAPELGLRTENRGVPPPVETAPREVRWDPESLTDLITKNCGAGTWERPGITISATPRVLIVRQYADVQREITRLLGELR